MGQGDMKIGLLGDSIRRIGYGRRLGDILGEEFEIWQPDDNGRFASYTLRMLFDYRTQLSECDIIHWNNGLWDTCALFEDGEPFTPIEVYVDTMVRIARILLAMTPRVIFATTTPVRPLEASVNRTIDEYNAALVPRLREMGVIINELGGAIAEDVERYIREDDKIHLSDEGIELAAERVAECIRAVAAGGGAKRRANSAERGETGIPV